MDQEVRELRRQRRISKREGRRFSLLYGFMENRDIPLEERIQDRIRFFLIEEIIVIRFFREDIKIREEDPFGFMMT